MKHCRHFVVLALAALLLSSCASLTGPRRVEIPLARMQATLDRHFPANHRILEIFDIRLQQPRLSLLPEDRVALTLQAEIAPPFTRQSWRGMLTVSGRLQVAAERGAVLLVAPRVEQLQLDGVDGETSAKLTRAASTLAERATLDLEVYHFRPEELRYGGVQFVPTTIATTPGALVITFEPVR
jgi:hypothetical protein